MRKIEKEMVHAVFNGGNWKKDNTEVVHTSSGTVWVFLHGNHIASIINGDLHVNTIVLSIWPTPTTKSRLRALGADVYTKAGVTYLNGEAV